MKKKIFLTKQIHSCFATVSTGDVFLYKLIDTDEVFDKEIERYGDNKLLLIKLEAEKMFYQIGLISHTINKRATKEEMDNIVKPYLKDGWTKKYPKEVKDYFNRMRTKETKKRENQGYLFPEYKKNRKSIEFKGGFSDIVYNRPSFKQYASGNPFGYIGHFVRKERLDKYLEKSFMGIKLPKKIAISLIDVLVLWLTSTDGRHFGDSLEDCSFARQKEKINNHLSSIFNKGFIYSLPEHDGSYKTFLKLEEKYKDILL